MDDARQRRRSRAGTRRTRTTIATSSTRVCVTTAAGTSGEGIASACALIDLEAVAIGGGFSKVSDDYVDLVQAAVDDVAPLSTIRGVRVVRSALSDEAPLIGAAGLIHRADLLP